MMNASIADTIVLQAAVRLYRKDIKEEVLPMAHGSRCSADRRVEKAVCLTGSSSTYKVRSEYREFILNANDEFAER